MARMQNLNRSSRNTESLSQQIGDFLQGRNGLDELSLFLLEIAVILFVLNTLLFHQLLLSWLIRFLVVYIVFRCMSYNISARRKESYAVVSKLGVFRLCISQPLLFVKEVKDYKHLSCAQCHQHMRVPRGKGIIRVTCPKCNHTFESKS